MSDQNNSGDQSGADPGAAAPAGNQQASTQAPTSTDGQSGNESSGNGWPSGEGGQQGGDGEGQDGGWPSGDGDGDQGGERADPNDFSAIELPEDRAGQFPDDYADGLVSWAKDKGLTPEAALAVQERDFARRDEEAKTLADTTKEWREKTETDPDIGGQRFAATMKAYDFALSHATPEFRQWLDVSGIKYHPEMVRLMTKLVAPRRESGGVVSGAAPSRGPKSVSEQYSSEYNNSPGI